MLILKELNRLIEDEDGLTMVEYAVAGALVAAGAALAFISLGNAVTDRIDNLCGIVTDGIDATEASTCGDAPAG
jgi:pilus assembly protein Flp/PilA